MTPAEIDRWCELSAKLRREGRLVEAQAAARRALDAGEGFAPAWFNLGAALSGLGNHRSAVDAYRKALHLNPAYAEAWSNLGGALGALGKPDEEIDAYRKALEANPALGPIWSNLGNALSKAGKSLEALAACRKAIELDPGFPPAWVNLGNALQDSNEHMEAIEAYQHACRAAPRLIEARLALGLTYKRAGSFEMARASFRQALEIDPTFHEAAWVLSLLLLALGEFDEGWRLYESRWLRSGAPIRRFTAGRTPGRPPFSGGMLVWGEQGLGDEILYCRMAAEIGPDTCGVTLEMDYRLVPLFSRTFPEIAVVARRDPPVLDPGAFDQIVPAASLGQWLRPAFKSFPGKPVPLKADPDRVSAYGRALRTSAPGMHGVVGLSWRSANPEYGSEKSAQLVDWGEIMTAPGASFVNLQYGNVDAELGRAEESCGRRIRGIPGLDLFDDIDGVAALASA